MMTFSVRFILVFLSGVFFTQEMARAEDKITRKNGTTLTGEVKSVSSGRILFSSGGITAPISIRDVQSVEMSSPIDINSLNTRKAPQEAIEKLKPVIEKYRGLPANWVADAMGLLADCYSALGKNEEAVSIYQNIRRLYPKNKKFLMKANLGMAKQALQSGDPEKTLKLTTPILKNLKKKGLEKTPSELYSLGETLLVSAQALEKTKKQKKALQYYLEIATLFPQNSQALQYAKQRANTLRKENPKLVID